MNAKICAFLPGCCLLFLAAPVFALENDAKWNGFYVGANTGPVIGQTNMQTTVAPYGTYFGDTVDAPQIASASDESSSQTRFSGGAFAGYQHYFNHLILGAEVSFNSLSIQDTQSTTDTFDSTPGVQFVMTQTVKAYWEGMLGLKVGYAADRWMVYLTGGPTLADLKYTSAYSDNNAQPDSGLPGAYGSGTTTQTKGAWAFGGGFEYAMTDNWFLQFKYLYSDLGTVETSYPVIPTATLDEFSSSMNGSASVTVQSFLMGLLYRF